MTDKGWKGEKGKFKMIWMKKSAALVMMWLMGTSRWTSDVDNEKAAA